MSLPLDHLLRTATWLRVRIRAERGQTLAEYGLLIALIVIVVVVAAVLFGSSVSSLFRNDGTHL